MQKTFGSWFKEIYLDKCHITAYKLSKETGIPSPIISKIINNQITLSVEKAILLGYYFNISPEELMNSAMFYEIRKKRILPEIKEKLNAITPRESDDTLS